MVATHPVHIRHVPLPLALAPAQLTAVLRQIGTGRVMAIGKPLEGKVAVSRVRRATSGAVERRHPRREGAEEAGCLVEGFVQHRIAVNCVFPALIDAVRGLQAGRRPGNLADDHFLLRCTGRLEEIAAVVRLLAFLEGSCAIRQAIRANGGVYMP